MNAEEIRRSVGSDVAPACAVGCSARGPLAALAPGGAGRAWRREVGGDTEVYFDIASVTKPMTAVAAARAAPAPITPLGALLVEARDTPSAGVALELFLAHRAGLVAHQPLYAPLVAPLGPRGSTAPFSRSGALRHAAAARREDAVGAAPPEGFPPLYSDLGYALAGEAIARAVGAADAGEAIARLVLEPLGVAARAGTARDLAARGVRGPFAPTEDVAWRGGLIQGAVHDENAWALTGLGGSGHAGIFATVDAVLAFGEAVLDTLDPRACGSSPWSGADLSWLVRERPGGTLRAGFDGKSAEGSSAGRRMGPRAFGHLGFTGTSLWIDPDAEVVVVFLTNRVSPSRDNTAIREARPRVHDALYERALAIRGVLGQARG
jgi:CubicO group peptidase (beta-lactamase class C family)